MLGKFVTAKLLGKDEARQGWILCADPLIIKGESGTEYLCEGTPTIVVNPPPLAFNLKKIKDCEHSRMLFEGSRICRDCGSVIIKHK